MLDKLTKILQTTYPELVIYISGTLICDTPHVMVRRPLGSRESSRADCDWIIIIYETYIYQNLSKPKGPMYNQVITNISDPDYFQIIDNLISTLETKNVR